MSTRNSYTGEPSEKCSICQDLMARGSFLLTTSCSHMFHLKCLQQLAQSKHPKCPLCREPLDLNDMLGSNNGSSKTTTDSNDNDDDIKKIRSSGSLSKSIILTSVDPYSTSNSDGHFTEWDCERCTFTNDGSHAICSICFEGKRPVVRPNITFQPSPSVPPPNNNRSTMVSPPLDESAEPYSWKSAVLKPTNWNCQKCGFTNDSSNVHCARCHKDDQHPVQSKYQPTSIHSPGENPSEKPSKPSVSEAIVYIPDLPFGMSDSELEEKIRSRLENAHYVSVAKIKCYSNIGIGVIHVSTESYKNNLLNDIQSMVLDHRTQTLISFVEELELISYLVLNTTKQATASPIPEDHDIKRRWEQVNKESQLSTCQRLSVHFPNIYKIVFVTFNGLIEAARTEAFTIHSFFANVYLRADCSFFEDLPANITEPEITTAINMQCGGQLKSSSLYVQCNKEALNAVILATDSARKWTTVNYIHLNGQAYIKKLHLALRLRIHPVPHDFPIQDILEHRTIRKAIVGHKHTGENLVIELNDKSIYEECLNVGALRVNDHRMFIDPYVVIINDPENTELTAENWYKTQMLTYSSDIKQFVVSPDHCIFKYKWNAKAWLEQFESLVGKRDRDIDNQRRLLRVTVMLNTIGVVKKKSYKIGDMQVDLKAEPLITIVYDHQSKLKNKQELPLITTPFGSTTVEVIQEDCVIVYNRLKSRTSRPVLLTMANAQTPGGGYRRGEGAQEENLFRRSNYYLSLDAELDDTKQSQRLRCMPSCELKPLAPDEDMYPMNDYGAIYTTGITMFRDTEEKGYAYLEQPINDVCAIAIAAHRDPDLKDNKTQLTRQYAIRMRKKIENLFAIAYNHGHDCLVLSAFGCGAFKNPPSHVAAIFKSVIQQYAGYFKTIHFAIIDDHNTGYRINPNGNYQPFKDVLGALHVHAPKHILRKNMATGPYRILKDSTEGGKICVDDVCICREQPCPCSTKCQEMENVQHTRSFSHPPLCFYHSACDQMQDRVHMDFFVHRLPCQFGGACKNIDDQRHLNAYEHPNFCVERGHCKNTDASHLLKFLHVPLCKDGFKCSKLIRSDRQHCEIYRHVKLNCQFGGSCVRFHDSEHIDDEQHPFNPPCPYTPYLCQHHVTALQQKGQVVHASSANTHCFRYSHVCPFGRQCKDIGNEDHIRCNIHIARMLCPDMDRCKLITDEDHLNSYSHPNIPDIRYLCRYPGSDCKDRWNRDHIKKFRHAGNFDHIGVVHYSGLNKHINFVRNQSEMIKTIRSYLESVNWKHSNIVISDELLQWIRALQPVHRCSKTIFESILVHGHVMSRDHMNLLRKPEFVANAVKQHKNVRSIFDRINNPVIQRTGQEYIQALVEIEFENAANATTTTTTAVVTNPIAAATMLPVTTTSGTALSTIPVSPLPSNDTDVGHRLGYKEHVLKEHIKKEGIDILKALTIEIAQASLLLNSTPTGIGFEPDKALGTSKHVFAILGPHTGHYYGDIFIVFRHELMCHPDTNFSIQAATTFGTSGNAFKFRPWLKDPGSPETRIEQFHHNKLHCSVPGYEFAAATELIALTGLRTQSTADVNLHAIQQRWMTIDSHSVFEAHLPQLIPLDYIHRVYIAKTTFDSMSASAQDSARKIFGSALSIEPYDIDISIAPAGLHQKLDPVRVQYQASVLQDISDTIGKKSNTPSSIWGSVITLPPSKFERHIAIPITISQSYNQYLSSQPSIANLRDVAYIYWQAMQGDMMLTVTNELINPSNVQPNLQCLTCYIAELPISTTFNTSSLVRVDYYEGYSYISNDQPFMHEVNARSRQVKTSSNSFHRGCNTEDYITYCLKIERNTGHVSLTHAGPNRIYNQEKIDYTFDKRELDLSKLDYIHLSAGSQTVPVCNLAIRHERIAELHPSVDKASKDMSKTTQVSDDNSATSVRKKQTTQQQPSSTSAYRGSPNSPEEEAASFYERTKNFVYNCMPDVSSLFPSSTQCRPCRDSINCLIQYTDTEEGRKHNAQYTHPCRFSELCRRQKDEPHLVHIQHLVSMCKDNEKCQQVGDPFHRAQYRHSKLPDYLIPCHYQKNCHYKTLDHKTKYSHGEKITLPSETDNYGK